jgi:hypothetical protein
MHATALRGALAGALVLLAGTAWAGEPLLPSPRPLVAEVVGPVSYVRPDPYEKWQNYGVDRYGRWRPLVTPYPDGLRYVGNGEPYPWYPNHPGIVRAMVANGANFAGAAPAPPPVIVEKPATRWDRMPYAE